MKYKVNAEINHKHVAITYNEQKSRYFIRQVGDTWNTLRLKMPLGWHLTREVGDAGLS